MLDDYQKHLHASPEVQGVHGVRRLPARDMVEDNRPIMAIKRLEPSRSGCSAATPTERSARQRNPAALAGLG